MGKLILQVDRFIGRRSGLLVLVTVNGAREVAWVYTVEATRIKRRRIVSGC